MTWKIGDRCYLECWGQRPAVVTALSAKDCAPVLGFDCKVKLEGSGQVVPYHQNRLIRAIKESMPKIKWHRSEEGYVSSKCGRFEICPAYNHSERPQWYDLFETSSTAGRKVVRKMIDTQKAAKEIAEAHANQGESHGQD